MGEWKWEVKKDEAGEWRSALIAANGETVFVSSEGYKNRAHALAMIAAAIDRAGEARIVVEGLGTF